ncbi:hypothetical protein ACG94M_04980 [Acinetobacter guillouiae]|jgi:hypothetical protein|uniref:hypothetical protein n=1 Tax=Acinetobacter guillouiae TaxID=106649 RepID=UPI003AF6507D
MAKLVVSLTNSKIKAEISTHKKNLEKPKMMAVAATFIDDSIRRYCHFDYITIRLIKKHAILSIHISPN